MEEEGKNEDATAPRSVTSYASMMQGMRTDEM